MFGEIQLPFIHMTLFSFIVFDDGGDTIVWMPSHQ